MCAAAIVAASTRVIEGGVEELIRIAAYVVFGNELAAISVIFCPSGRPMPDRSIAASTVVAINRRCSDSSSHHPFGIWTSTPLGSLKFTKFEGRSSLLVGCVLRSCAILSAANCFLTSASFVFSSSLDGNCSQGGLSVTAGAGLADEGERGATASRRWHSSK